MSKANYPLLVRAQISGGISLYRACSQTMRTGPRSLCFSSLLQICLCVLTALTFLLPLDAALADDIPEIKTTDYANAAVSTIPELTALPVSEPGQARYSMAFTPSFPSQSAFALLHATIATELLDRAAQSLSDTVILPSQIEDTANHPDKQKLLPLFRALAIRLGTISFQETTQTDNDTGLCTVTGIMTMPAEKDLGQIAEALKEKDDLETISLALTLRDEALKKLTTKTAPLFPDPRDRTGQPFSGESKKQAQQWLSKQELRMLTARLEGVEKALNLLACNNTSLWADLKTTISKLRSATENDPDNPVLLYLLGRALIREKPQATAIEAFNKSLDAAPKHAAALYERGLAFFSLHLPEQALEDFSQALSIRKAANFLMARGTTYMKLGNMPAMCQDYAEACTLGQCESYQWARSKGYCDNPISINTQP